MGLTSCCMGICKEISGENHNQFIFYKSENYQTRANNNPSVQELMADKNVKKALIHNSAQTIFVGHDDGGKAYYGEVNHKNEENANNFINTVFKGRNKFISDGYN